MRVSLFLVVILALWAVPPMRSSAADGDSPEVGRRHADLTLPRIDTGEAVSLSDYRGRKLLLIQFASW